MPELVPLAEKKGKEQEIERLKERLETTEEYTANAGVFLFFAGFAGLVYECYRWLQTGAWEPERTWTLGRALIGENWLRAPQSWIGLHKIVVELLDVPVFITYPGLAWIVVWFMSVSYRDEIEKSINKLRDQYSIYD